MLTRIRLQALIILAAGALLGYLAASSRFLSGPEAIAAPVLGVQENSQPGEAITITVRLPADAVLEIDGYKTESTGTLCTFQTPPLGAGKESSYTLKATSKGKEVTRKIDIAHGAKNSFDLRAEFQTTTAPKPAAKRIAAYGQPAKSPRNIIFVICDQE